jgi:putative transposase
MLTLGYRGALRAVFPSAAWQACLFHLAQNAQNYAPNHRMRQELSQAVRAIYQAPNIEEAEECLRRTVSRYSERAGKFCNWLEERFREGLTFYQFPASHWRKIRTNNVSERLNQEIKRRTRIARLFPDEASCLRVVSAIVMEIHEDWMSGRRYIDFQSK